MKPHFLLSYANLLFIGLSFLFIETKELCEATAKLETSSNFQIYPGKSEDLPHPAKTGSTLTELYTLQSGQ